MEIATDGSRATIAGGATVDDVRQALDRAGLTASLGAVGTARVADVVCSGGYGPLAATLGLAADGLLSATIVTGCGSVRVADSDHDEDLFWLLRGGGPPPGIVVSLDIAIRPAPPCFAGVIAYDLAHLTPVLDCVRQLFGTTTEQLELELTTGESPEGRPRLVVAPTWTGSGPDGAEAIRPLLSCAPTIFADIRDRPLSHARRLAGRFGPDSRTAVIASLRLRALNSHSANLLAEAINKRPHETCGFALHEFFGAAARVPRWLSAVPVREQHLLLLIVTPDIPAWLSDSRAWAERLTSALSRAGALIEIPGEIVASNLVRKQKVRAACDPCGMFATDGERLPCPVAGYRLV